MYEQKGKFWLLALLTFLEEVFVVTTYVFWLIGEAQAGWTAKSYTIVLGMIPFFAFAFLFFVRCFGPKDYTHMNVLQLLSSNAFLVAHWVFVAVLRTCFPVFNGGEAGPAAIAVSVIALAATFTLFYLNLHVMARCAKRVMKKNDFLIGIDCILSTLLFLAEIIYLACTSALF